MAHALTSAQFANWLDRYGRAWEDRDAAQAGALFTDGATYRETPFDPPLEGRSAIEKYWAKVVTGQKDVRFTHEAIACTGDEGVYRWHVAFTGVPGGEVIDLDGIFRCRFADSDHVAVFGEWWHIKIVPPAT